MLSWKLQKVKQISSGTYIWEMEFHSQSIEHCYGRLCEVYKAGVRARVPLAVYKVGKLEQRERDEVYLKMVESKRAYECRV